MEGQLEISTDKSLLNSNMIFEYLSKRSYWAKNRSLDIVKKSIENSLCFGIYLDSKQIGFARIVTDYSVFAWLMDVFVLEDYKGKGYGKALLKEVRYSNELSTVTKWGLSTHDAHGLYKQFGFQSLERPENMMELSLKV